MISNKAKKQIDTWIQKYPKGRQSSAVMEALKIVQAENENSLSAEAIAEVADYLDMSSIAAAEVATFYENYNHKPVGKHTIRICHNISCMLNGADDLVSYLEKKLGVKTGQVTKNGLLNVKKVECLGACVGAPMFQIGDTYYENLTEKKIDDIVDNLK
ncbi:NADH-ubiquinone oxidoreductase chain E (EC [uncultured Gammaproteobacteria bacterium]|jgi:NADH-quinone oxidoreductase subunit E|uniref:NADH-quinone oxidoreductase subunit NuoE n=1 Tax=thiotrophic endosymbiont of Bathymodiolus puteoserpentis (Logatchev) TaxID=343240 RepID=UPI0010B9E949|nr:NAD(P)H-dependent oxidoreductase subunit E [thiotrophic endosymbiont of Bathymodiolus puteoserpentis (Logatchev)]CAC9498738.1 NADH-ubiquinone oxidoreductase chain E (EC 1.6.5.3) [uncultured Gammaproteobacteria bacterium]CAC9598698.1 NADH-ubiquinone oxidoreductase chain E (EC 1.6.5.3) [uncultured Gammaproteobacteria bacterium]CAC9605727.1 NADH-ubiquinone oxidoreductase chain E (EC 1.6.5.3) [uncultured Gammaproteobacteria bacterium]CAC9632224.1 NADH-ubiquinone oxidoreductase chain E (EC 1.6.5.